MSENLLNKEAVERLGSSKLVHDMPEVLETLEGVAGAMKSTECELGTVIMEFADDRNLRSGEYVPYLILAVVSADAIIEGRRIVVDMEGKDENQED